MKRIFIILAVAVALLLLAPLTWLLGTESGLHWTLARVTPLLPVELSIGEIHGRLIGPIAADDVRVHHADVDVRIGQLELDWTPAALLLGKLRLSRVHARDVDVGLHPAPATDEPFKLGINLSVADARVEQLSVRRAGTNPIQLARLELAGHASSDGFGVSRLYLKREDLVVEVEGALNLDSERALNGDIRWSVRLADYPALAGAGSVRGNSKHAVTTQTLAPPFAGRLSAELKDLKTAWHWSAKLELQQLALNQIQAQWPALHVRGQVQARGDAAAIQANANLEARQPNYEGVARLDAQLAWDTAAHSTLDVSWHDLAWPIGKSWLASPRGELQLKGTLNDYALRLATALHYAPDAKADVRVQGRGNEHALRLNTIQIAALDGNAKGHAELTWSPQFTWNTELHGRGFNPAAFHKDWPGRIGFEAKLRGTAERAELQQLQAAGTLRGRSFNLQSKMTAAARTIDVQQLELSAAGTRLSAHGSYGARALAMAWNLNVDDLSWLLPMLRGSLASRGEFGGTREAPRIAASAEGSNISWRAKRMENFRARADVGASDSKVTLTANGVDVPGASFKQVELQAEGQLAQHRLRAELVALDNRLELDANGAYTDGAWSGKLVQGRFYSKHGQWQTEQAAALALRADALRLDNWCWRHAQDRVCAQAEWQRASAEQKNTLNGRFTADVRDLAALAAWVPQLEQPRGHLQADLRLDGTLAEPRVAGQATLKQASFRVPQLGIDVREIELRLQQADAKTLALNGSARFVEGVLNVAGRVEFGAPDTWAAHVTLKGRNLLVSNTEELELFISPDLALQARPRSIQLEGDIHVPRAEIRPRATTAILPSSDVTYVGAASERTTITSRVRLILGQNVRVRAYDFDGQIAGELQVVDQPQQTSSAQGELRVVSGQYTVYRKTLQVERGRLFYNGGALDDPWLDVRATRRIGGELGEVVVGVEARGTLKRPQLTLVSVPSMNDTDILAYMLLDHPIDQASTSEGKLLANASMALQLAGGELLARHIGSRFGIQDVRIEQQKENKAALVLGRYLSPRLYVSYGVGLFETGNALRLRYQLGRHWQAQTETGTNTGVDLLYTIER